MPDIIRNLFEIFTRTPIAVNVKEKCESLELTFGLEKDEDLLEEEPFTGLISERDGITVRWRIIGSDEYDNTDFISTNDNWQDFRLEYNENDKGTEIEMLISVSKNISNHILSIYSYCHFSNYLQNLSFSDFVSVLDQYFDNYLYFEVFDENFQPWHTRTIAFIPVGGQRVIDEEDCLNINRDSLTSLRNSVCNVDGDSNVSLIPEDFYSIEVINSELMNSFRKVCSLLSASFLFNSSSIQNDKYIYKLLGLVAYTNINLETPNVSAMDISINTTLYNIYKWSYSNGSIFDKIAIVRNIISLNINKENLKLNDDTFYSIQSNYQIYEKENSMQYIELRNKISEILLNLQGKINNITDEYLDGMKKNIFTIVSFIITTIVIRMVSNQNVLDGFTIPLLILMIVILLSSFCYLFLYRYDVIKKIELFERHYNQLSQRYDKLLCRAELDTVFSDCNPDNDEKHSSIMNKRVKIITWSWVIIITLFLIATIVLFFV